MERRAFELFKELLDLAPLARADALAAIEDAAVRARVEALLARDAAAHALDHAPLAGAGAALGARLAEEAAAPHVDVPPERVGSYRLLRLIGSGGMGVVYEAEQDHPRRRVALKTTHRWLRSSRDRERFRGEVEAIGGLLHPAIPQVYEVVEHDGAPWLAMELVQGQRADRAVAGWSVFRRAALLQQLAEAVAHAASAGLVHGDIKPANVLVTPAGAPKLLDFGLALRAGSEDRGGGTEGYRSPGQEIDGGLDPDVRTDVFALGRLGARLIPDAPTDLAAILTRATQPARGDRYADAGAMAQDLGRFLRDEPVQARRWTPTYALARWGRRHRTAVAGFALAVAAVASLAVVGTIAGAAIDALRERRAAEAWARLDARLAAWDAAGDRAAADAAFATFVALPDYVGTRAVAQAWLHRAAEVDDPSARLDHLANAYAAAPDAAMRDAALVAIARHAVAETDLALLAAVGPRIDAPPADLAVATALAHADFAAAAAAGGPLSGVFGPWARGAALGQRDLAASSVIRRGDALWWLEYGQPAVKVFDRGGLHDGPAVAPPVPGRFGGPRLVGDGPTLVVRQDLGPFDVWDLDAGRVAFVAPPGRPRGLAVGAGAAWLGVYGGAGVFERRPLRDGRPTTPDPEVERLDSDLQSLAWVDLDGDGTEELVGALGAWRAFGVRAWQVDGDTLRVLDDVRLGNVSHVVRYMGPGGAARVVAFKDDRYPSVDVFGAEHPEGRPAGAYVLGWRDGFVELDVLPMRRALEDPPWVGDVDGDGRDDLVATTDHDTWVARQRADGGFDGAWVRGVVALGVGQLDDDPADELLVARGKDVWALGVGDTPWAPEPAPPAAPPAGDDAADYAEELAAIGLGGRAAARLRFLAGLTEGDAAARLWRRAGDVQREDPAAGRAVLNDYALALVHGTDPALRHETAERLVRVAAGRGDWDRVAEVLPIAGDDPSLADVRAGLARWAAAPQVDVPVGREAWRVVAPESAPPGPSGHIRAFARQGDLWVRPVRVVDGPVSIDASIDVHRLEVGGQLRIVLRPVGGEPVLTLHVAGYGGGGVARLRVGCAIPEQAILDVIDVENVDRHVELGIAWEGTTWRCRWDQGDREGRPVAIPPGDYELALQGFGPDWPAEQLAEVIVRRLTARGLVLGAPGPSVTDPVVAAVDDADPVALRAALPAALRDPARAARVRRLLRTHHRVLLPVLVDVDPAFAAEAYGYAWNKAQREIGKRTTQDALDEPALASLRSTVPGWLATQRWRARLASARGRDDLAVRILEDVVALDPTGDEGRAARRALAILAEARGDAAAATAWIRAWAAGSTTPVYDRLDLARDAPALAARL